ncbi:hypothetical protein ACETK8_14605 [Brevundimonas staleyi]|uniref:Uncharacterized protein n=1 Tax=Brevundimonas staleyi TaxID=74326 RepID=A0ABW0FYE1_9CAUL
MGPQHVGCFDQSCGLHIEQQRLGGLFRASQAFPHRTDGGDGAPRVQGDGVGDEGIRAANLEVQRCEDRFGEVPEIVGDDDGGLGLERCGDDMGIVRVRQVSIGV